MNTVTCKHCGKSFELSEALTHQMTEKVRLEQEKLHKVELEKTRLEAEEKSLKKVEAEFELKFKNSQNEADETAKKNKQLQEELLGSTKKIRSLEQKDTERELEMQKKLIIERDRISEEVSKNFREKSDMEIAEIKKQLDDTKKALEDAQRKAAQKSQQLQGEVLELELENILRLAFPHDEIMPVGKGVLGADVSHIVKSPKGYECGTILWEFKRTKDWSDLWIGKLKKDIRAGKALFGVIVSLNLPKEAGEGFGVKEGVWVCSPSLILPLATILRQNILDVGYQKAISANKGEKAGMLYSYVTSHEFQQQVENIVEAYKEILTQITKERAVFERSWKQREIQAQRILMSSANIVGSMQGIVGASMPPIKGLEIEEIEESQQSLLE